MNTGISTAIVIRGWRDNVENDQSRYDYYGGECAPSQINYVQPAVPGHFVTKHSFAKKLKVGYMLHGVTVIDKHVIAVNKLDSDELVNPAHWAEYMIGQDKRLIWHRKGAATCSKDECMFCLLRENLKLFKETRGDYTVTFYPSRGRVGGLKSQSNSRRWVVWCHEHSGSGVFNNSFLKNVREMYPGCFVGYHSGMINGCLHFHVFSPARFTINIGRTLNVSSIDCETMHSCAKWLWQAYHLAFKKKNPILFESNRLFDLMQPFGSLWENVGPESKAMITYVLYCLALGSVYYSLEGVEEFTQVFLVMQKVDCMETRLCELVVDSFKRGVVLLNETSVGKMKLPEYVELLDFKTY
jgi:hypothetical protein